MKDMLEILMYPVYFMIVLIMYAIPFIGVGFLAYVYDKLIGLVI